jgi:dTDP-4-amino-4,6-dideoxygalactose transaminase
VEQVVASRNRLGVQLDALLRTIPDVTPQQTPAGCRHGYFLYLFKLDLDRLRCTSQEFSEALAAEGVPNRARLITGGMPVYQYRIFQNRSAFPGSEWPLAGRAYRKGDCPVAEDAFDRWVTMNIYEHYTETDVREIAHGIGKVARHLSGVPFTAKT